MGEVTGEGVERPLASYPLPREHTSVPAISDQGDITTMKPPTEPKETVDDGYGLQFVGKTPEFIQEITDMLQESLDRLEKALESTIDTWEDIYEDDHLKFIKFLEDNLRVGPPLVDLNDPEAVAMAIKEIDDAKIKYAEDKNKYEERKAKEEAAIAHRKAQMVVAKDALRRAQEGLA